MGILLVLLDYEIINVTFIGPNYTNKGWNNCVKTSNRLTQQRLTSQGGCVIGGRAISIAVICLSSMSYQRSYIRVFRYTKINNIQEIISYTAHFTCVLIKLPIVARKSIEVIGWSMGQIWTSELRYQVAHRKLTRAILIHLACHSSTRVAIM